MLAQLLSTSLRTSLRKPLAQGQKPLCRFTCLDNALDTEPIMALAEKHGLYVVEDNAQAIGADYTFSNGKKQKAGTVAHIGTTSFFPSKNLDATGMGVPS